MTAPHLTFITGNAGKLRELRAILGNDIEVNSHALDLPEIQGTIEDISRDKCRRAAEVVQGPVLVEDTALCFSALGGLPGPYIKHFLEALRPEGLPNLLAAYDNKTIEAVCTLAFMAGPGHEPRLFQGRTPVWGVSAIAREASKVNTARLIAFQGRLVPPRGPRNFGWDPCFEFEGETFAEMDAARKNQISHRYKAVNAFRDWYTGPR